MIFKIPKYQLYLLQLENYELGRYLRLLFKKGLLPPKEGLRKNLVWTMKARLIFCCAFLTHLLLSVAMFYWLTNGLPVFSIKYLVLSILFFIILIPLYFIFYTLYFVILWPIDWLAKHAIINRAKLRIKDKGARIKIIGIAGSYGKTTMKEVLRQVLSIKYKVLSTEDSVNTPVGVARWILRKVDESTEIIIVEMGEHYRGDILELCKLTPPDIAVITGINEAHMERMGSMDNVEATIFEIAQGMKPGGRLMLNGDDENVLNNHQKYIKTGQQIEKYQVSSIKYPSFAKATEGRQVFNTQSLYWKLQVDDISDIKLHLLGEYALGDADCAVQIAKILGMNKEDIKLGIEKIRPVEHRLQPSFSPGNILVIDDAYNGNSDGAREAIKVLSRFKDRRKIYITPGLVETGSSSKEVHLAIGQQLATVADVVILIRNSVTSFILEGINDSIKYQVSSIKQGKPEIVWFNTAPEAHKELKNILQPNDVILFQNDWGDQYI